MAQQLKKKFIGNDQVDSSKILLEQGQAIRVKDSTGTEQELIKLGALDEVLVNGEEVSLKQDLDSEISRAESAEQGLQSSIDQEVSDREAAVSAEESSRQAADLLLDGKIETEKGRIDAILSASQADKDSFAEIVSLINSVDTENDQAFAGYVSSNDARSTQIESDLAQEILDREAADQTISTNLQNLADSVGAGFDSLTGAIKVTTSGAAGVELANATTHHYEFIGTNTHTLKMHAVEDMSDGEAFTVVNRSTGVITLKNSSNVTIGSVPPQHSTRIVQLEGQFLISGTMLLTTLGWNSANQKIINVGSGVSSADAVNKGQLDAVEAQVTQEIADRSSAVSAEESARIAADNALDARLDVLEADPVTKTYVDGEVSDLQSQINNVLSNVDGAALDSLTEIVSAFQAADASLNGAITSLSSGLSADIDAEEAARIAADSALAQDISDEETARIAADSALQSSVDEKVAKSGDTMSGSLVIEDLSGNSVEISSTIIDLYGVAGESGNLSPTSLQLSNASGTGSVSISTETGISVTINSLPFMPQADSELTSKAYVDSSVSDASDALQSQIDGHETRIDVLESVVWFKEKFSISNGQTSVTLSHSPEAGSMSAFVDRLAIHEGSGEDYTISGTTMTFLNDLVSPGQSQLGSGDTIYVKYQYKV